MKLVLIHRQQECIHGEILNRNLFRHYVTGYIIHPEFSAQ